MANKTMMNIYAQSRQNGYYISSRVEYRQKAKERNVVENGKQFIKYLANCVKQLYN